MSADTPIPFPRRSWDDEATLLADLARELDACEHADPPRPMEIVCRPASAFQLAAAIQLALRHPGMPANVRAPARAFLDGVRAYFADCPAILEALRRGDR